MNIDKLKSIIQQANPEIMELKFGCEVQVLIDEEYLSELKRPAKHIPKVNNGIITVKHPDVEKSWKIEFDGITGFYYENEIYKILGRPIRLDDYLQVLGKVGYNSTEDWFKVLSWTVENWKPGYLSDQSEEVINKLYKNVSKTR